MNWLELLLPEGKSAYWPGETVVGSAIWQLDEPAREIELRLFWHTEGKGDRDLEIVAWQRIESASPTGQREFSLTIPDTAPPSFSGKLISLLWAIELVVEPGARAARVEITVGPEGREVLLPQDAP